jgi:hypothetical protein
MEMITQRGLMTTLILLVACSQLVWAQNPLKFEEYLKQNPTVYQNYQSIQKGFKDEPGLDETVRELTLWHKELVQDKLIEPMQKLFKALDKNPGNFADKQEYKNALAKFIEICKTSFPKDDSFRKEAGDDQFATWVFWAAAFMAIEDAEYTMYRQNQQKSYMIGAAVLNFYTGTVLNVIYANKRDNAALADFFRKQTDMMVQWVNKIPLELRK